MSQVPLQQEAFGATAVKGINSADHLLEFFLVPDRPCFAVGHGDYQRAVTIRSNPQRCPTYSSLILNIAVQLFVLNISNTMCHILTVFGRVICAPAYFALPNF
jgi:hypothetical protein